MNKEAVEFVKARLKHAREYDPMGPNSSARYGSAAASIEKQSVIKMLEELLALLAKPCEWKWNKNSSMWEPECRDMPWRYIKPEFCPFCGQPIKEITE